MKLYIVGFGPGSETGMTLAARAALEESETIIGYTVYTDLIRSIFPDKEYRSTPMTKEEERCRLAIETVLAGKPAALVCSGDSGVYGLAGLVYELAQEYDPIEIEPVAGVTAASAGAALLGAPLIHDFALVSLSDRLTPWEDICSRLTHSAQAGFVLCLYNPSSKKRHDYLHRACTVLLEVLPPETVCGYAQNIGRDLEHAVVTSLGELKDTAVDMFTTVFIGNKHTREVGGRMVTPRGYRYER